VRKTAKGGTIDAQHGLSHSMLFAYSSMVAPPVDPVLLRPVDEASIAGATAELLKTENI
jgi:hypothetical protein